ncbi:uncharacterized protein LOC105392346 isoform X2 [Plutella xylostella]|uniref:uncharacterized protein LOC105392346 isoform X2 n=1 Tax=Plutella xylostella TaxID=51655 RepID=UPI00203301BF|nr:uncharacterized protein LOC105392346 isoform X2 [Plutella xylostella]
MNDSEIESLRNELEYEKRCRETASWQNGHLEKQIVNLQEDLRRPDYSWDGDEELEKESDRHRNLLEAIESLRKELPILKDKIRNAKICGPDCRLKHDDLNINLDILTPLFVRVNDQRTYLHNELMICQNNIMRLQRNAPFGHYNVARRSDERVLDPKRGPIKKIFGEKLAPIST